MRKIRTMLLLALTTGVLGVFAAPALAEEYNWYNYGQPVVEPLAIQLEGKGKFTVGADAVRCDIEAEATLFLGGTGEVTKFDFTACTLGSVPPAQCELEKFSNDVPWSIHIVGPGRPVIEDMTFSTSFGSFCALYSPYSWGPVDMTGYFSTNYMTNVDFEGDAEGRAVHADLDVSPEEISIVPAE